MNILEKKRREAIERMHAEEQEWDKQMRMQELKHQKRLYDSHKWKISLRRATPYDYREWLDSYLSKGGEITHTYNYNMPDNFFVAVENIEVTPLFGSASVNIIVPHGVKICGSYGHNNFYSFDDGHNGFVPLYLDT